MPSLRSFKAVRREVISPIRSKIIREVKSIFRHLKNSSRKSATTTQATDVNPQRPPPMDIGLRESIEQLNQTHSGPQIGLTETESEREAKILQTLGISVGTFTRLNGERMHSPGLDTPPQGGTSTTMHAHDESERPTPLGEDYQNDRPSEPAPVQEPPFYDDNVPVGSRENDEDYQNNGPQDSQSAPQDHYAQSLASIQVRPQDQQSASNLDVDDYQNDLPSVSPLERDEFLPQTMGHGEHAPLSTQSETLGEMAQKFGAVVSPLSQEQWQQVREMVKQVQQERGVGDPIKITTRDPLNKFGRPFIVLNGEPYAMEYHGIMGQGIQGRVRKAVSENGEALAVKIITQENGDKYYHIQKHLGTELSNLQFDLNYAQRMEVAVQLAQDLTNLHQKDVIHCDIHSGNILVDDKGRVHMIDFGKGFKLDESDQTVQVPLSVKRNFLTGSPEVKSKGEFSKKSDVYALGKFLTLDPPRGMGINLPSGLRVELMHDDPEQRPSMEQALNMIQQYQAEWLQKNQSRTEVGLDIGLPADMPAPPAPNVNPQDMYNTELPPVQAIERPGEVDARDMYNTELPPARPLEQSGEHLYDTELPPARPLTDDVPQEVDPKDMYQNELPPVDPMDFPATPEDLQQALYQNDDNHPQKPPEDEGHLDAAPVVTFGWQSAKPDRERFNPTDKLAEQRRATDKGFHAEQGNWSPQGRVVVEDADSPSERAPDKTSEKDVSEARPPKNR